MAEEEKTKGFAELMMGVYDVATMFAAKEGKSHREVFQLLCSYLEVHYQVEQKKLEIELLSKKVEDLKKQSIILTAIKEGKVGKG